jgi:hypothetical protein
MSRKKDIFSWGIIVLALVLIAATALYVLWPQLQPHATVRIGDGVFAARVANTHETREKGLSGTQNLRQEEAMLFVYDTDSKWSVWMKDMNYPIDIVWLNSKKEVVYIVKNAAPESYPYENFSPKQDARYILEFAAGTVDRKKIIVGKEAAFDENNLEGLGL